MQTIHRRFARHLNRTILIQILCAVLLLGGVLFALITHQHSQQRTLTLEHFEASWRAQLASQSSAFDETIQTLGALNLMLARQGGEMISAPRHFENRELLLGRVGDHYRNSVDEAGRFTLYTGPASSISASLRRELRSLSLLLPMLEDAMDALPVTPIRLNAHLGDRITLSVPALTEPLGQSSDRNITQERPFGLLLSNPRDQWRLLLDAPKPHSFGQLIAPIFVDEELLGMVSMALPTQMLTQWLSALDLPEGVHGLIWHDALGALAYSPDAPHWLLHTPHAPPADTLLLSESFAQGELSLMVATDPDHLLARQQGLFGQLILYAAAALLLVAIFYLFFMLYAHKQLHRLTASLTRPMDEIVRFSHNIGMRTAGRLGASGVKELDELANHLHLAHSRLMRMLIVDNLTGTSNRRKLLLDLRERGHWGLVVLNLNRFKHLNDVFGYAAGDYVLKRTVELLEAIECDSCETYRIGADEFALLFEAQNEAAVLTLAQSVNRAIGEGFYYFNDIEMEISASIGCALGDHKDGEQLLSRADIALSHSRKSPHQQITLYTPDLQSRKEHEANLYWERRIKEAIRNETMLAWFQPIGDLKSGQVTRFEALVRIVEKGEVVPPYYFLEAARQTGLLFEIARRMIDRTFAEAARHEGIEFSINLALSDLEHQELLSVIEQALARYGVEPERFTFELLETEAMAESKTTHEMVLALKERGFKIAIDDFGSGYSNFSRFMELPVDYIKIDGQFIKNLHRDETARHVVRAILEFADGMGAEVVAEYVETRHIYEAVKRFDIGAVQGFYLSKPVPAEEIKGLIKR